MSASASISLGSGLTTWSSQQGSGYDYTSLGTVTDPASYTNFTGAISPPSGTGRPVLINSFSMTFTNSTGSVKLQLSSAIGGGNRSTTNFSGNGTKTYNPNFPTFLNYDFYYGFQKQDSSTVRWTNTSGGTIYGNGTAVSAFGDYRISGSYSYLTIPGPASGLVVTSKTSSRIDLDWNPPSDNGGTNLTGYRIAYRSSGGAWQFKTQGTTSAGFIDGLAGNTTYEIEVAALNAVTAAHNSNYASTTAHVGSAVSITETTVAAVPLPTFSGSFPDGRVGQFYASTVTISGTSISSVSSSGTTFPAGLNGSFSGTTSYTVSGFPTSSSSSGSISLSATNPGGTATFGPDSISIAPPFTPSWSDLTFNQADFGEAYSDSISASNADYVTASVTSVAGMSVTASGSTVTISGTPNQSGSFSFSVTAYSAPDNGTRLESTQTAFITVDAQPVPTWSDIVINQNAELQRVYSDSISATDATLYSVISGFLPPGITLTPSTGQISGTPTQLGEYNFTVRASNNSGTATPDQSFTIFVNFPGASRYQVNDFVKIRQKAARWDDSVNQWVNLSTAKRFNGSSWVDL